MVGRGGYRVQQILEREFPLRHHESNRLEDSDFSSQVQYGSSPIKSGLADVSGYLSEISGLEGGGKDVMAGPALENGV